MIHGVLNIDKPAGMTSNALSTFIKRLLNEKALGFLGTLDPLATGVLPFMLGYAARLAEYSEGGKEYQAVCRLGMETDTDDVTGRTLCEKSALELDPEAVKQAVLEIGSITEQVPPMVSALQVNGVRLYKLARQGKTVDRPPRPIRIEEVEVLAIELPRVTFRVACSAGTYVRSLCRTVGEQLGVGGCLEELRRTRADAFRVQDAVTPQVLEAAVKKGEWMHLLQPSRTLVGSLPVLKPPHEDIEELCQGQVIRWDSKDSGVYQILNEAGKLCVIAEMKDSSLKPLKTFGMEGI